MAGTGWDCGVFESMGKAMGRLREGHTMFLRGQVSGETRN